MKVPNTIIENTLVPHTAFERAMKSVEQCFQYSQQTAEPICLAIVGEARTGKTRVQEESIAAHPPTRNVEGISNPILHIKTPSRPTVKGLAELMLRALRDPAFDKGTESAKTTRLLTLLATTGTRMIIIDEFQHFYDRGTHTVMHHVADWLKIIADDSRIALVVAGLPTSMAVLEQNEQLAGRFLAPVYMPRFDWDTPDLREEFVAILEAFDESLREYFDLPELGSEEMAFRVYCGTGGLIGYLAKFLRKAVWNAIDEHHRKITLADLEKAHRQSVWNTNLLPGIPAPFSRNFDPSPDPAVLARVRDIGRAIESPKETRMSRTPQRRAPTVAQALSAR